jgi:hypothetical protein
MTTKTKNEIEDFETETVPLEISDYQSSLAGTQVCRPTPTTNVVANELESMTAEAIELERQAAARKRELYSRYVAALVSGDAKSKDLRGIIAELGLTAEHVDADFAAVQKLLSTIESSQYLDNLVLEQRRLREQAAEFDEFVKAVTTELRKARQSLLTKEQSIRNASRDLLSIASRRPELFGGRVRANGLDLPSLLGSSIPIPDPPPSDYETCEVLRVEGTVGSLTSDQVEVEGRVFVRAVGEFGGAKVIIERLVGDEWDGLGHHFRCSNPFIRCLDPRGQDLTIRVRVTGITPRSSFTIYLDQ